MKLVQFYTPALGTRLGLAQRDMVLDLSAGQPRFTSFMSLLEAAGGQVRRLEELVDECRKSVPLNAKFDWRELDRQPDPSLPHLLTPIFPSEVWGFGVTYQRSAAARDADVQLQEPEATGSIYDQVYRSERPECFFKATASRCVGPNGSIGIRSDSRLTATEPELAYVLGANREIIGYIICNDVSAWDLERENPLYLPQSKIYAGCCALGPAIVTASEIGDPYALKISCKISRGNELIYQDETNSGRISRRFEVLNEFLYRDNPIPLGTVVSTGTGIMVPNEHCLKDGDVVEIEIDGIGVLRNWARRL